MSSRVCIWFVFLRFQIYINSVWNTCISIQISLSEFHQKHDKQYDLLDLRHVLYRCSVYTCLCCNVSASIRVIFVVYYLYTACDHIVFILYFIHYVVTAHLPIVNHLPISVMTSPAMDPTVPSTRFIHLCSNHLFYGHVEIAICKLLPEEWVICDECVIHRLLG